MDTQRIKCLAICLSCFFFMASCVQGTDKTNDSAGVATTGTVTDDDLGYNAVPVENGGSISGAVTFSGTIPAPRTVVITDDVEACGESVKIEDIEVKVGGGLRNVVVSLVDINSGASLEMLASPPVLEQHLCRFVPHIMFVPINQVVDILNSDPVSHNIHTVAFDNRTFNRTQPPSLDKIEASFEIAEKVKVKCDIHGWMNSWIVVVDHPYHAITDAEGNFVIENVPPGTYTLEAWHEIIGATKRQVTIDSGQTTDLSIELKQIS